ncbi:hypothetical protein ASPVEDRAFT_427373 [Aspergillus versicolor CBS 583.65]|uniref:Uncharacterized protein n=1 Tax=Aspergillus versicolor CBS 583.65 TaxID=1036611 RepID=A0A1L9P8G6_ASPVE|nr:uncharacterized protein ASPVEDRAFT_427373 [Aspergillus versicolor CBS 583.65]OJI97763.1 hypothetical protein ASPVEDRAFT_427373 [Aspergillus versicolor CBS 583.65]
MFKYTLWKSIILETYPPRSVTAFESACSSASMLRRSFFPASFFLIACLIIIPTPIWTAFSLLSARISI